MDCIEGLVATIGTAFSRRMKGLDAGYDFDA
jgi:hypothetical protein